MAVNLDQWHQDDEGSWWWKCEVCEQLVQQAGPWCDLYMEQKRMTCMKRAYLRLLLADAQGDGPLVNEIVWEMRKRYGINGAWW